MIDCPVCCDRLIDWTGFFWIVFWQELGNFLAMRCAFGDGCVDGPARLKMEVEFTSLQGSFHFWTLGLLDFPDRGSRLAWKDFKDHRQNHHHVI
jgi:hypothetical protein